MGTVQRRFQPKGDCLERIYRVVIVGLSVAMTAIAGCITGGDSGPPVELTDSASPAAVAPGGWQVEPGVRVAEASAPATLRLPDGTYRMYLPGLSMRTSPDGLSLERTHENRPQ